MFRRRQPTQPPSDASDEPLATAADTDSGEPADPTPSTASDAKGPAMSTSTPRTPGQGFVPEIPRRSAVDIPGAPSRRQTARDGDEGKRLVVGREISLSGEITACDTLVVEGTVQATLEHSHALEVADGGTFKGRVQISEATIAGRFEGELNVRGTLTVKGTGVVDGKVKFGKLEVELGGSIMGEIAPIGTDSETPQQP